MKYVIQHCETSEFFSAMRGNNPDWTNKKKDARVFQTEAAAKSCIIDCVLFPCKVINNELLPDSNNWIYETKCRRCGNITEWFFAEKKNVSKPQLITTMDDYLHNPRMRNCDHCGKQTIQDLISYN